MLVEGVVEKVEIDHRSVEEIPIHSNPIESLLIAVPRIGQLECDVNLVGQKSPRDWLDVGFGTAYRSPSPLLRPRDAQPDHSDQDRRRGEQANPIERQRRWCLNRQLVVQLCE